MKRWLSLLLVLSFAGSAVAMVGWMGKTPVATIASPEQSQAPQPGEIPPPQVASAPPATGPSSQLISPDFNKLDAVALLDPPEVGSTAPDFKTTDALGKPIGLKQFLGKKNVILVFYQGHFCPVCGHQLDNIQKHMTDYQAMNTEIVAISADDKTLAQKTLGEHGLGFHVVPDPNKVIIKAYGVRNVVKGNIAWPSSFIIDTLGRVRLSVADPSGKRLHSDSFLPVLSRLSGRPVPQGLSYED
jgi:peroxiredoxin